MAIKQAMGVYTKTVLIPEEALRTLPSTLDGKGYILPFNSNTLSSTQNTTTPSTMSGRRDATEPIYGNIDVSGNLTIPLDTVACGVLFASAFGKPTTTEATGVASGVKKLYTHIFKPSKEQPSFAVEKIFNNGICSVVKGVKINKLSFNFGGDGELTVGADVIGCDEEIKDTQTSKSPKEISINRLNNFQASLLIDGEETAVVTDMSLEIAFGLDGNSYTIGGKGYRSRINEGLIEPSGNLTAFFDDKKFLDKAMKAETTKIQVKFKKGDHELLIDLPEVMFSRKTPAIENATGLVQKLDYHGFYKENKDNSCIKITLINETEEYNDFNV